MSEEGKIIDGVEIPAELWAKLADAYYEIMMFCQRKADGDDRSYYDPDKEPF